MKERIFYQILNGKKVFIHIHFSKSSTDKTFLLLNSVLYSFGTSKLQAEIGRGLNNFNYNAVRFDYYGTGDSEGETFEFNVKDISKELVLINQFLTNKFNFEIIGLIGIELGGNFSVKYSNLLPVKNLILIDPIFNTVEYIRHNLLRIKMTDISHNLSIRRDLVINNKKFIDYEGIPLSLENLEAIKVLYNDCFVTENKNILLINMDFRSNLKNQVILPKENDYFSIQRIMSIKNTVHYEKINVPLFQKFGILKQVISSFFVKTELINIPEKSTLNK
jgi:hypothetical protein